MTRINIITIYLLWWRKNKQSVPNSWICWANTTQHSGVENRTDLINTIVFLSVP